ATARRRLLDPRDARRAPVVRPGAALDGALELDLHRSRPDRAARRPGERHRRHAADARAAAEPAARRRLDGDRSARARARRVTLWGGRVEKGLAPEVADFLRAPDRELLPYDCAASKLHAPRLAEAELLSAAELAEAEDALDRIAEEGGVTDADEDVHSAIERLLGDLGRK